jgi:hypothetical protein
MTLHGCVALNPGDLMELQFPIAEPSRFNAVVRNRNGNCLGLEFIGQLPPDTEAAADVVAQPEMEKRRSPLV